MITAISKLHWFCVVARNIGRVAGYTRLVGRNDDKAMRLAA
jgi:hypothetical protein